MSRVHPTAVVDPHAELDTDVEIGPYAVVGKHVRVGARTVVGAHVVLEGPCDIGCDNRIHAHAVLGGAPQDMKYRGEPTTLRIGDRNTIREFCTFNRGTVQDQGLTQVGNDNWIMAYVHIAHDVRVGDRTILANNATLAGHVQVGDWVIVGGLTGVHQFCRIGAHAMTGFQSHVSQDVPPFMMAAGHPLAVHGFNVEGLRRRGFSPGRIAQVKRMHRLLYRQGLTLEAARAKIAGLCEEQAAEEIAEPGLAEDRDLMLGFLATAGRGIAR